MDILLKIRFNSSKSSIESFGNNRHIVHLVSSEEDADKEEELKALISRKLGVPSSRIHLKHKDAYGNYIYEI